MYRNDIEAMEARLHALDAEVADRMRARDQAAQMLAEAKARAEMSGLAADWAAGGPIARRRRRALVAVCVLGGMMLSAGVAGLYRHYHRADDQFPRVLATFTAFTDQMCACKDKECTTRVSDAMTQWGLEMSREQSSSTRPTDEQMRELTVVGERMGRCVQAAIEQEAH